MSGNTAYGFSAVPTTVRRSLDTYQGDYGALNWTGVPLLAKFFFQLVFAGTAATIVSGAVAERIKYISFIFFSACHGHRHLPGCWTLDLGRRLAAVDKHFLDFAGSTQVHSIGGWAALVGVFMLGPRIGKYGPDGKPRAIPGHNMTRRHHWLLDPLAGLVRI